MRRVKFSWKNGRDSGAIEGLPLYLLILVVITAVAIGVVMYWLNQVKGTAELGEIKVEPGLVKANQTTQINITTTGTDGKPISGVAVSVLAGRSVDNLGGGPLTGTSDSSGKVALKVFPKLTENARDGEITVIAKKTGRVGQITKEFTILVAA